MSDGTSASGSSGLGGNLLWFGAGLVVAAIIGVHLG